MKDTTRTDLALEKRRKTNKLIFKIFGGILALIVVIVAIGAAVGGGEDEDDDVPPAASSAPTAEQSTETETPEPEPEETTPATEPAPEPEPDPEPTAKTLAELVTEAVEGAEIVNDTDDQVQIQFEISDSLTRGFIRSGAKSDTLALLQAVKESDRDPAEVRIGGNFPTTDQYGNDGESLVLNVLYERATLERINFDNINPDNAWAIADTAYVHPDLAD